METIIGSDLLNKEGPTTFDKTVKAEYYGIYFSAHWCPPCRMFTPELADIYNEMNASATEDSK